MPTLGPGAWSNSCRTFLPAADSRRCSHIACDLPLRRRSELSSERRPSDACYGAAIASVNVKLIKMRSV